ncbi:MAG: hypothetical protein JWN32_492 [Solirubrobacterales bacterium]|nr:hypothetical protein [Solirubrobacterales bacterium]
MTTVPNWLAFVGLVVPAATGLAGYVLAGRNDRARDERAAAREAIARRASVSERLEEQRHAFQRQTLLELQDVLQRMVRCTAKVILHDQQTLKESGTLTQVGEELSNESYEIGVATRRLQERVLDPALRGAAEQFRAHVTGHELSAVALRELSADDALKRLEAQLRDLNGQYVVISDLVGASLRVELGWLPSEVPAAPSA